MKLRPPEGRKWKKSALPHSPQNPRSAQSELLKVRTCSSPEIVKALTPAVER